jgi:nucleoside-diphosphate-sugar epimerase
MKVFVTGGAGYIGSVLVPMLLEKGHEVTIFDRFLWGKAPILHFAGHPNLEIVHGDVREREDMRALIDESDAVIHLAAIVGYPSCNQDPDLAHSTNVYGTQNVVDLVTHQKLVFASTGSVYGSADDHCSEDTKLNPVSLYGETKATGEEICLEKDAVILRFATAFGIAPRLRFDLLVNDFVYKALKEKKIELYEGHFKRTFIHVKDIAKAFVFSLENYDDMAGEVFNIGSNKMNFTKADILKKIRDHVNFEWNESDFDFDQDRRNYHVNFDKVNKLGFDTSFDMDLGIQELVKIMSVIEEKRV